MLTVKLIDTNKLAKMFQEADLCVKRFCEELCCSRTTFYNWGTAKGRETVRLYTIEDIANALGIHPFELIEISEQESYVSDAEDDDANFNLIFPEEENKVCKIRKANENQSCTYEVELNFAQIVSCLEKLWDDEHGCGYTVEQACSKKYLGCSRSTFYSWKNYPKRISLRYIAKISNAFKIHPHDIITVREIPLTKAK